jgi:predicted deacylase
MIVMRHALPLSIPGTERHIVSWHFGKAGARPKAYLQAGLHADEWPPMLIALHLRQLLSALEADGAVIGEIVLVPAANPIGLAQIVHGTPYGRFDLADGRNFNRGYPAVGEAVDEIVKDMLSGDPERNVEIIRAAMQQALAAGHVASDTQALKQYLMLQACDADIVLDLHCDNEALMHLYAGTIHPKESMNLAMLTRARVLLIAAESGDQPFDEALAQPWGYLASRHTSRHPIPHACFSVTLEFRGQTDLSHQLAHEDAVHLTQFLAIRGVLSMPPFELPAPQYQTCSLDAVEILHAPHGGLLVPIAQLGEEIKEGETVAELIDPLADRVTELKARQSGLFFAHTGQRYVPAGAGLAKIAGAASIRVGHLLGP